MKYKWLLSTVFITLAVPAFASPKTITGKLTWGGGVDDMALYVKAPSSKELQIYCNGQCGDWFEYNDPENEDYQGLKTIFKNKKIRVTYNAEKNNGRVAGPSDDEKLNFAKKITFIR